jgi:hypothetical protein
VERLPGIVPGGHFNITCVHAVRGDADTAFTWLDKAVAMHDTQVPYIMNEILLRPLHNDPRWLPLLRRPGRAPEQLANIKFDIRMPQ